MMDASAWDRWVTTGPAFRSVLSGIDGDEGVFGWSASVGGGGVLFEREELCLGITVGITGAFYSDGVELTQNLGIQGNF